MGRGMDDGHNAHFGEVVNLRLFVYHELASLDRYHVSALVIVLRLQLS